MISPAKTGKGKLLMNKVASRTIFITKKRVQLETGVLMIASCAIMKAAKISLFVFREGSLDSRILRGPQNLDDYKPL